MKKILILLTLLTTILNAEDIILSQGNIKVTLADLDGFAYRIPEKDRSGFFQSSQRVEKTLFTILNMKQIVQYGKEKKLFNETKIEEIVFNRITLFAPEEFTNFKMVKDKKIILIENFIRHEEQYKAIQSSIFDLVNKIDLDDLVRERFISSQLEYKVKKNIDADFISVVYNDNNKSNQKKFAKQLLDSIVENQTTFEKEYTKYIDTLVKDIELSSVKKLEQENNNKNLTMVLFPKEKIGLFPKLIDFNSRFLIVNIVNINNERLQTFEEAKDKITNKIKQKISERKFNSVLNSITKDELKVNKENLSIIKTRYTLK